MKTLKFIGEIYKKGFGAFKLNSKLTGNGTEKSKYMKLVCSLEMISVTISLITAIIGVIGFFTSKFDYTTDTMYRTFPLKVIMWIFIVSAVLNAMDRFQKENRNGKVKRLMFAVVVNIICLVSFEARNIAVGIFGLVKLVCLPIAVISGLIFVFSELTKMSSIDNEYNSIKEPLKVFGTHVIGLPIYLMLIQIIVYLVKVALFVGVLIVIFGAMKIILPFGGMVSTPLAGVQNVLDRGVKQPKVVNKKSSDINKYKNELKRLERGLEGARKKEVGYFHVDINGTERRAKEVRRKINQLEA
ncbi:MAG: hypothetical protein E7258_02425 [Lachnospiraceae bacterium]|nr:hypothetical protein [Lachnospiraceae bacterium]